MAAGLHGSARTTPRVRAELQAAQAPTRSLAARYGLNPKTVAKWRRRTTVTDAPMGPRRPRSTVLTEAEDGYVHADVCELRLAAGRLFLFLAIDRVSNYAHVAFYDANTKLNGAAFLREVVAAFPCRLHTVLTGNGMAFADLPKNRGRHPEIEAIFGGHTFDRVCAEHGITHKLTKRYHPWTSGQAERMNRTVKEATIRAFHYPDLEALKAHVLSFVAADNFAEHLKRLRWRTPFQAVCDAWTRDPAPFRIDPRHLIPGPHRVDQGHAGAGPAGDAAARGIPPGGGCRRRAGVGRFPVGAGPRQPFSLGRGIAAGSWSSPRSARPAAAPR